MQQSKNGLRKWTPILGAVFMVFLLAAGCDSSSSSSSSSNNQKVYSVNEDAPSGDVMWKVTKVRDRGTSLKASESRYPSIARTKTTTGRFIELTFMVENKGKDLASITEPKLIDSQNREFTSSTDTSEWIPEGKELFILDNLQPNLPKEFIVIYEVPAGTAGLKAKVGVLHPQTIDLGI